MYLGSTSFFGGISGGKFLELGNFIFGSGTTCTFMSFESCLTDNPINLVNYVMKVSQHFAMGGFLHVGWNLGRLTPYLRPALTWSQFKLSAHNMKEQNGFSENKKSCFGFKFSLGADYQICEDQNWFVGASASFLRYQALSLYAKGMEATYTAAPRFLNVSLSLRYIF